MATHFSASRAPSNEEVPAPVRGLLYALLIVAGVAGLLTPGRTGPLPATALLDIWIVAFLLVSVFRGRIQSNGTLLLLSAYALTRVVPALANESPMYDFVQAYRWLFYLFVFAIAVGRHWGPVGPLVRITWLLVALALAKSVITYVLGAGDRPGLLIENNFELALFCGLVIVVYHHMSRYRLLMILLMGVLTVLAQSRSGAVAYAILVVFAVSQAKTANVFVRYLLTLIAPAGALLAWNIFQERSEGVATVDRLNFLAVFLREAESWSVLDWVIGTVPITPLSPGACSSLAYYAVLYSTSGDGSCYSVILHSFLLRVVFDAGVLGLLIAFGTSWYLMRRSGVQLPTTIGLVAIAVSNSASVSGPNNPYVALPILLAILLAPLAVKPISGRDSFQSEPKVRSAGGNAVTM